MSLTKEVPLVTLAFMDDSAKQLNEILKDSIAEKVLSDTGKRFFFPEGIITQCADAGKYASSMNVSVGIASTNRKPFETDILKKILPGFEAAEAVSYAPAQGDPELLTLWKNEIIRKNTDINPKYISNPVAVSGLTNGISHIATLFTNQGDKIIIPDLYWENYKLIFETRSQGEIITYPLFTNSSADKISSFNIEALIETAENNNSSKKIILILNFPNNPAGYTPSISEASVMVSALCKLADQGYSITAVCDDAYFGLVYENDVYTQSLFALLSKAHENILAVKVDGATKEHFAWGLRIAFITYGSKGLSQSQLQVLVEKTKGAVRASVSSCSRLSQTILLKLLKNNDYWTEHKKYNAVLKERYKKVKKALIKYRDQKILKPLPFNSGYFLSFIFAGDAELLRKTLLKNFGIGTVAIKNKYLRVTYASAESSKIKELISIIYKCALEIGDPCLI